MSAPPSPRPGEEIDLKKELERKRRERKRDAYFAELAEQEKGPAKKKGAVAAGGKKRR